MEHPHVPNWLADAVMAAGMATVYNADDWIRISDRAAHTPQSANDEPPLTLN